MSCRARPCLRRPAGALRQRVPVPAADGLRWEAGALGRAARAERVQPRGEPPQGSVSVRRRSDPRNREGTDRGPPGGGPEYSALWWPLRARRRREPAPSVPAEPRAEHPWRPWLRTASRGASGQRIAAYACVGVGAVALAVGTALFCRERATRMPTGRRSTRTGNALRRPTLRRRRTRCGASRRR